jgi:hypothetical protein
MYESGLKKTGGQFLKTESGGKYRLRILNMPSVSAFKKDDGGITYRFNWPVWSYDDEAVKILTKGRSVLTQLDAISEEYGEKLPMDCDIVLTHKGSGFDTVYTVVPGKIKSELPSDWQAKMPDLLTDPKSNIPYENWVKGSEPIAKESSVHSEQVPVETYNNDLEASE